MTDSDLRIIEQQLQRKPRGVVEVIKRCEHSRPLVILNSPFLDDKTPFPTLFWLTCPKLVKRISKFEDEGLAKHWQEEIGRSRNLREQLKKTQLDYQRRLLTLAEQTHFESGQKVDRRKFKRGISGVEDITKVKCLHAHYAYFLAIGNNPIGKMVAELLGDFKCQKTCL